MTLSKENPTPMSNFVSRLRPEGQPASLGEALRLGGFRLLHWNSSNSGRTNVSHYALG
jgi:hypothetical protein